MQEWDTVNRCGAGKWSTSKSDPFSHYCNLHDLAYLRGGTLTDLAKADKAFIRGIWQNATRHPLRIPRAILYTGIVTLIARYFWRPCNRLEGETCETGKFKDPKDQGSVDSP
jgi:hypothetical protein